MAAVAAAALHAHVARRQVDVVVDDDHVAQVDAVLLGEFLDRTPRDVHERLGLGQDEVLVGKADDRHLRATLVLPVGGAKVVGKQVDSEKPGIVPGSLILRARISKPDDHSSHSVSLLFLGLRADELRLGRGGALFGLRLFLDGRSGD